MKIIKPIVVVKVNEIVMRWPFNMKAVADLKKLIKPDQRRWNPTLKSWHISTKEENYEKILVIINKHWPGTKIPVFSETGDVQATFGLAIDTTNYYTTLQVGELATLSEIKKAHRKIVMKLHPDQNKSSQAADHFILVQKAYKVLCDPKKRSKYDRMRGLVTRKKPLRREDNIFGSMNTMGYRNVYPTPSAWQTKAALQATLKRAKTIKIEVPEWNRLINAYPARDILYFRDHMKRNGLLDYEAVYDSFGKASTVTISNCIILEKAAQIREYNKKKEAKSRLFERKEKEKFEIKDFLKSLKSG